MQLSAKFSVPFTNQQHYVPRPRLVKKLDAGEEVRLILVSAPAGFGKTALLSGWAKSASIPVVWLSLDEQDNDPLDFLILLIQGLQSVSPKIGEAILLSIKEDERNPLEQLTIQLIQEIDALEFTVGLIIDDYQKITNNQIHHILETLITNKTPRCQLILATRTEPPWKLTRWQLMGELVEINASDLRFNRQEVNSLFNEMIGLSLEENDVTRLAEKSGGWIAGLRMLALSLEELNGPVTNITSLLESNRLIQSYLLEEVFDKLASDLRKFLVASAALEKMCPELCDFALDIKGSRELLKELERNNIFIESMDNQQNWFRFDALFHGMLTQQHLALLSEEEQKYIHARASAWLEEHGHIEEALNHALTANDASRVANLAANHSLGQLHHSTLRMLLQWIETLSPALIEEHPWLSAARCWALALSHQFDKLRTHLDLLTSAAPPGDEKLQAHISALRIYFEPDCRRIKESASLALDLLPKEAVTIRVMILNILGESLMQSGSLIEARVAFSKAVDAGQAAGDLSHLLKAKSSLAHVYLLEGRIFDSLEILKQSLNDAGEISTQLAGRFPQIAYIYLQLAQIYLEWFDLEKAYKYIDMASHAAHSLGNPALLARIHLTRAEIKFTVGDEIGMDNLIKEARMLAASNIVDQNTDDLHCYDAELSFKQRHRADQRNWLDRIEDAIKKQPLFTIRDCLLSYAHYLVQDDQPKKAIEILLNFSQICQDSGSILYLVRTHTVLALAYKKLGKQFDAMTNLEQAITLAQPNRLVKSIIGCGKDIEDLLNRAFQLDIRPEFVQDLIVIFRRTSSAESYNEYQELLSKREHQILKYLVTDLTVPEIADGLVISTGTVRSHIKRIYRKLDVHRRKEAVEKARELNLLVENQSVQWG